MDSKRELTKKNRYKFFLLFLLFLFLSCSESKIDNKNIKLITKLKKRVEYQNEEIQKLMSKLSSCKEDIHIKDENPLGEIIITLNNKTYSYFNGKSLGKIDLISLSDIKVNEINTIKLDRDGLPQRVIEIRKCNWQKDDNGYFYKKNIYLSDNLVKKDKNDNEIDNESNNENNKEIIKKEIIKKEKYIASLQNIKGGCFKSDILRVIHNSKSFFDYCIKDKSRGKLKLNWEISEDGDVNWVNIKNNSVGNRAIVGCFINIIKKGRYNSNSKICEVSYLFNLN